ncbi:MAG TPA: ATP-binding protein, partial [Ktedonobacteraceae bacterium]
DHLRKAYSPSATEVYDKVLDNMREAELLVLDDLGAQQSTPWATEKLFQLLNYRYNYCMPTVITTNNLGLQGIDERLRSRMTDSGLVTIAVIDRTIDYRPRNPRHV